MMQDHTSEQELTERLRSIERMMAEGRRTTESWGWTFVLWGFAYYIAIAWAAFGQGAWAWPVTMASAVIVTVLASSTKRRGHPATTLGRAIGSIWIALGTSMFVLFAALGLSGRLTDPHVFIAVAAAILGMANGASALILRWKVQLACAVVWWVAAVATCFGSDAQSMIVFLIAIFFCQIAFGIYGMIAKAQERRRLMSSDV
jgi:hypothetical protein